ncbi:MAG: hypothetical protein EZS28_025995 [Streblomastix strix]|uniref:Uncharacterized protein n=1 Tax=Streblomastix strix TaxID=222440 RepID=A0A5J4V710_9EUKA|nr:MAG: hypothetical protein EZS28_025995 [Streblomastix strix]
MIEEVSMDSYTNPSLSSSSEEDQRRTDRSNDNSCTMTRPYMVYRTGNENVQSLILGWSNEILKPGSSLIKKNLKFLPGQMYRFLMDRMPGQEEDSQERF